MDWLKPHAEHEAVEYAFALENPFPDEGDDDGGEEDGIKKDAAEEAASAYFGVEDEGGDEGDENHAADLEENEDGCVKDGSPKSVFTAGIGVEEVAAVEQGGKVV